MELVCSNSDFEIVNWHDALLLSLLDLCLHCSTCLLSSPFAVMRRQLAVCRDTWQRVQRQWHRVHDRWCSWQGLLLARAFCTPALPLPTAKLR